MAVAIGGETPARRAGTKAAASRAWRSAVKPTASGSSSSATGSMRPSSGCGARCRSMSRHWTTLRTSHVPASTGRGSRNPSGSSRPGSVNKVTVCGRIPLRRASRPETSAGPLRRAARHVCEQLHSSAMRVRRRSGRCTCRKTGGTGGGFIRQRPRRPSATRCVQILQSGRGPTRPTTRQRATATEMHDGNRTPCRTPVHARPRAQRRRRARSGRQEAAAVAAGGARRRFQRAAAERSRRHGGQDRRHVQRHRVGESAHGARDGAGRSAGGQGGPHAASRRDGSASGCVGRDGSLAQHAHGRPAVADDRGDPHDHRGREG
jgi:hypothetical protein